MNSCFTYCYKRNHVYGRLLINPTPIEQKTFSYLNSIEMFIMSAYLHGTLNPCDNFVGRSGFWVFIMYGCTSTFNFNSPPFYCRKRKGRTFKVESNFFTSVGVKLFKTKCFITALSIFQKTSKLICFARSLETTN